MTASAVRTRPGPALSHASLVLRLGERLMALPLRSVQEVFRMVAPAAQLPRAPRTCLGLVDVRGQLVPIFDVGARLGLTPNRSLAQLVDAHVVLVRDPVGLVGHVVDEVRELVEAEPEPLEGGAATLGAMTQGAVRCSDGSVAPLVDAAGLLTLVARHMLRAALGGPPVGEGV
jgi:purine-binding chemotaxis protein CheW